MLKKRFDFLVATVFLGLLPIDAHAYLDPGTGSMLLSVVMGLVSTGYFVIRRLPSMMRALFFRMTLQVVKRSLKAQKRSRHFS